MREVFSGEKHDPGAVFYTITERDVGRQVIHTEIGPIYLVNVLGSVLAGDVGRRLYRQRRDDGSWHWAAESEDQMALRLRR